MNLDFGPELEEFRSEVRELLRDFADTDGYFHHEGEHDVATRRLYRALAEKNWLALSWPVEVGGEGRSPMFEFVLWDEMARARAARPPLGSGIVAKTIIAVGTDDQKERFLPGLRSGETWFSLGYSEPEAGSDLTGLRTRARLDGDHYVVNGEKRWTSGGHRADYLWTLVRTGTQESRGRGLTILIVDRTSPGITISPIPAVSGERFNEIRFDDVEVPVENRVGEENEGWRVITESLATERHVSFPPARVRQDFDDLLAWLRARDLTDDPAVRAGLVDLAVDVAEAEALALNMCEAVQLGRDAVVAAAANKLIGAEVCQRVARLAGDVGAADAIVVGSDIEYLWRQSICETIGGGTSEIMRGVIARAGLGLVAKG